MPGALTQRAVWVVGRICGDSNLCHPFTLTQVRFYARKITDLVLKRNTEAAVKPTGAGTIGVPDVILRTFQPMRRGRGQVRREIPLPDQIL